MADFEKILRETSYPGRGIMIGRTADGAKAVTAYFIMGRSVNSRNRIFVEEGEGIRTEAFDPSKMEDPSLIIYAPVRVYGNKTIVTNGDQTDTIYEFLEKGKSFEEALQTRQFEPDRPNFTPRISGIVEFEAQTMAGPGFAYKMSILKSEDPEGTRCWRYTYCYEPEAGLGHFIHTYECDGNPLPTFAGEPERISVPDEIEEFSQELWRNLDADNKISLYVRFTDPATGEYEERLINKNA